LLLVQQNSIFRSKEEVPVYHFAFDIPKNTLFEAYAWMERKTAI
jgi:hypothetical protein